MKKIDFKQKSTKADRDAAVVDATLGRIATRRWEAQSAGIVINGMVIDSDEASQGLIAGAALEALIDPEYVLRWKIPAAPGGRIEIAAPQVIAIARAVRAHIQACFDNEFALVDKVKDGTFQESDLETGWPSVPPKAKE